MKPLAKRHLALFHEMMKVQSFKPRLTISKALAFIMAMLIHGATVAIAVLGVYCLIGAIYSKSGTTIMFVFFAVVSLVVAWAVAPRFLFKKPEKILSREKFPVIYSLTDQIAQTLNIRPADGIILSYAYNARMLRIGLKQQNFLEIGMPLWLMLDDQEKIALLAHELAHIANGDLFNTLVIGSARQSLERWCGNLRPARRLFLQDIVRTFFWSLLYVLRRLLSYESQRAEYLADSMGANISSTDSSVGVLYKLGFAEEYGAFLKRNIESRRADHLLERFRSYINDLPEEKMKNIIESRERRETLYSLSHPLLGYRIAILRTFLVTNAKVQMTPGQSTALKKEFLEVERETEGLFNHIAENRFMYR